VWNRSFGVALPLLLLGAGAYDGLRLLRRARVEASRVPFTLLSGAATALGVLCVGLVYLGAMTPEAVNYDSAWYHLREAQDYARWGRLAPIYDYNAIVPHLSSIFYTWGYLVPGFGAAGLGRAGRWMMALHLEFSVFLWTLAGVAACVQRLVEDWQLRATWPVFFLFPSIFVYDNNLGAAADHVLAFYSVPVVLATLHVCRGFGRGRSALLAITLGGAVLTKYQAIYLLAPVGVIVTVAWARGWLRLTRPGVAAADLRRNLRWAPLILVGVGSLVVAPHFLKNWIYYHNPVYPLMGSVFTGSTPTVPDAQLGIDYIFTDTRWVPKGAGVDKLRHALQLFFTFSFKPHYTFNNDVPSFGSLFTLLLPAILFVRARRSMAIAVIIASGALMTWCLTFNVDRNLQTFLPILVCVTAALLVKLWRVGWLARLGLIPLVGLQLAWGADAPFYAGHDRIESAMELMRSGFEGRARSRLDGYRSGYVAVGKALPRDAKVVLHTHHLSLGIDRDVLQDWAGFQGLITAAYSHTPRELYEYYRSLGITHLLEQPPARPASTKQEEVLFDVLVERYGVPTGHFGGFRLTALPSKPPPVEAPYQVLCLGLSGYADGLYPIETLTTNEHLPSQVQRYNSPQRPATSAELGELLTAASAVLIRGSGDLASEARPRVTAEFELVRTQVEVGVYVRRR
jgi:hypothetical protein